MIEPKSNTALVVKNQRLDSPEIYGKRKHYRSKTKSSNKITPNSAILIDQYCIQPSSEDLPPATLRNKIEIHGQALHRETLKLIIG